MLNKMLLRLSQLPVVPNKMLIRLHHRAINLRQLVRTRRANTQQRQQHPLPPPHRQGILSNTQIASDYHDSLVTVAAIPTTHGKGLTHQVVYYEDWATGPGANPMTFDVTS